MFTNPLNRKYQTGGSAPTDDQKKDMQEFVTWIKSNVEGFKDKSEQEIVKSLSDMAKSDEGKKSVQDLYSRYQKAKKQKSKFADGGKFQDFICKHKRGGNVDCGCGGMVIRGEDGIDSVPDGFLQSDTPVHAAALAAKKTVRLPWFGIGRRRVGATIDQNGGKHFYEWGDVNGNTAQTTVSIPAPGDTIVKQSVATNRGWIPNTYPQGSTQYETIMERFRPIVDTGVPYKEDGGVVSEQEGGELTRKQARILSRHNKGFNRGQFQLAMANADAALRANTDLRGRDLRQAKRRMVAGLNDKPLAISTTIESPTLVAPSTGLVRSEVVEAPKANVAATQASSTLQRSASTNRRSNIARPEDFPMQEIVIPQISTNIPFGNGSRTSEKEITPVIEVGPLTETRDYQSEIFDAMHKFGPWVEWGQGGIYETDSEGNRIIKDEGNGVYWIRNAEGKLEKHEPVRTATIATSAPRRNYSAITGQPLRNGQSTWDLFKQGGKIEKHQNANGKIATSNVTPVGKVTQIRFPKILFGPGHNTVSFKSDDGLVHTWTRYDDGVYAYNSSPSNITKIYSPKAKETKNVRDGLKHTTITYPIDSTLTQKVDALIDDNTKWWK